MTSNNGLVLDQYEDSNWKKLPEWVREAAEELGYTKRLWNRDQEPESVRKDWKNLSTSQQEAAKRLGYTEEVWDNEDDDSSSSSSSSSSDEEHAKTTDPSIVVAKPKSTRPKLSDLCLQDVHKHPKRTIYCLQLYTETKDIKFCVEDAKGLTMYANRSLSANEFIVRSPVGPCVHEGLFEFDGNSNDGKLSEERSGFAKRFLEWHDAHGKTNRDGAHNYRCDITLADFFNPSTTPTSYRNLPQSNHFVYDLELFEHEIVLVEFVPPPTNPNHELPPERRFEILPYDEALVGCEMGEEGYDPYTTKRPPTLCGIENRSLELPGHFGNHASGASSTAYDMLLEPGKQLYACASLHNLLAKHATDLPEFLKEELAAKEQAVETHVFSAHLTARRALGIGTEITTDYSRWHWSNSDMSCLGDSRRTPIGYFLGSPTNERWEWDHLQPKMMRAAKILGFTRELWNSKTASPPSFEKSWRELSLQEQQAAIDLTGHDQDSWDRRNGIETQNTDDDSVMTSVEELDWADLSEEQKKAAGIIGFTEALWNDESIDFEDFLGEDLYFYSYRPEIKDAMVLLGITEFKWEDCDNSDGEYGDAEPWFECTCGDAECHSSKEKGGFRGVKYFPLEEQCRLGPLCEPWVQQQLLWRLYQLEQQQQDDTTSEREKRKRNHSE